MQISNCLWYCSECKRGKVGPDWLPFPNSRGFAFVSKDKDEHKIPQCCNSDMMPIDSFVPHEEEISSENQRLKNLVLVLERRVQEFEGLVKELEEQILNVYDDPISL